MRKIFLLLVFALSITTLSVFANQPAYVSVKMNGETLYFPDPEARPQIINDRTMVPFRQAAEFLDIDLDFEDSTRTISFNHEGNSFLHVMFTSFIILNGETITYDTPSQNINGYTIMPITMLLDAIGAEYSWDDSTRTVLIQTAIEEEEEEEEEIILPQVMDISTNVSSVDSDDPVTVTITASATTERIQLLTAAGDNITTLTSSTTNVNGTREFTYVWEPSVTSTGFVNIRAVPGTSSEYIPANSSGARSVSILVNAPIPVEITDIEVRNSSVIISETVTFYVYTSESVEHIRFSSTAHSSPFEVTEFTKLNSGGRRFTVTETFNATGNVTVTVEAANRHGYDSNATRTHTINVLSTSQHANDAVVIDNIALNSNTVRPGSIVPVRVITTFSVERVRILSSSGEIIDTRTTSSTRDSAANERTWDFEIQIPNNSHGQEFIFFATATGGNKSDEQRFIIASDRDAEILELRIRDVEFANSVREGRSVPVTLTTSYNTDRIVVMDDNDIVVHTANTSDTHSLSADRRTWTFSLDIDDVGRHRFFIYAYNSFGNEVMRRIEITGTNASTSGSGSSSSSVLIQDYELDDIDYIFNDFIYVTVRTSRDVNRVWIEDPSGTSVASRNSRSSSSGNSHFWDLSFRANYREGSNVTYTIFAQDGNSTDDMNFSIFIGSR